MKFQFCGNMDCPEWALSEVALLNRISAIKLKLVLAQIIKKLTGQAYDLDKVQKLLRDAKFDGEETKVVVAIIEFLIVQATKHQVSDKVFSKDLLQMGVAIENGNAMTKVFGEHYEAIARVQKQNALRVSQIQGVNYSLSFLMGSSMGGIHSSPETGAAPMDIAVGLNIDLKEFPKTVGMPTSATLAVQPPKDVVHPIKFSVSRDKFL